MYWKEIRLRYFGEDTRMYWKAALEDGKSRVALNIEMEDFQIDNVILLYCPKCGAEVYGYIQSHYRFGSGYPRQEFQEVPQTEDTCPICGHPCADKWQNKEIRDCNPYISGNGYFEDASEERKDHIRETIQKKISQLENGSVSTRVKISTSGIAEIRSNPEKLREYIYHLIQVESNIYAIKPRLEELYFQQIENEKFVIFCENIRNKYAFEIRKMEEQLAVYEDYLRTLRRKQNDTNKPIHYPEEPPKPQLFHVGFFDFILGNAERNKQLMAEYEKKMSAYRNEVADCDERKSKQEAERASYEAEIKKIIEDLAERIAEMKAQLNEPTEPLTVSPAIIKKSMIDREIQQAEETLRNLIATRLALYNTNIVFSKYRDLVALSTFYEYLMAGRCTSLEGANGVYNLYETEIRSNLIITKLSDIIEELEEIKNNQYTIASLLENINSQMDSLNRTMRKAEDSLSKISANTLRIAETSEVIAHNTAVTAYYSKVNAELTDAMGYLVAYNS